MEQDRAKEILKALADGRDPATGGQFPAPDSPYQRAGQGSNPPQPLTVPRPLITPGKSS